MKKFKNLLPAVAIVAIGIFSCQKLDEPSQDTSSTVSESHRVTFVADMTKTAISVDVENETAAYTWENTSDKYVHLFENGKEGSSSSISIESGNSKATFGATFSGLAIGEIYYHAVIASSYSDGVTTVPAHQCPSATSFDPAADILLGQSDRYYVRPLGGLDLYTASGVKLYFARPNAVTRLVLAGMKAGEKVESVEIECGNAIAGPLNKLDNFVFQGYDTANGSKKISLSFTDNNTVAADGTFVTYFSSWAVAPASFSVTVSTDQGVYAKEKADASSFSFKRDALNRLRISLENQDVPDDRFELVSGIPSTWDGTYIFVNTNKEGSAKILNATSSSTGYSSDVVVKSYKGQLFIDGTDAVKDLSWDLSDSGKSTGGEKLWNVMTGTARILFSTAQYLYDNDGITVSSKNYTGLIFRKYFYHLFAADENGVQMTSIYNSSNKTYLCYNGSSFEYNGNSSNRVFIYKYNDGSRKSQILAYDNDVVNWTLTDGGYVLGQTYDGQPFSESSTYQKDLLSFSSSDETIATVDSDGRVTIKKEGDVTITAIAAASAEYRGARASYVIRIFTPYYQRITSMDDVTLGDKYLIVSKTELLGSWYHAFCATNTESYDYDINTLKDVFDSPILDGGNKIRPSAALDENQIVIEQSTIAKLQGKYLIRPLSVDKYLYCKTELASVVSETIPFPTYSIAFAESSGASWIEQLEQLATVGHSIKFNEDGTVVLNSGYNELGLGGDLFYSKLINEFSYVNLRILDGFSDVSELLEYLAQFSEYEDLIKWIASLGKGITIQDIVDYFSADMYIYKYIG